ncbi:MAG: membrane protein of unknown function [Promethearchaeota archaeon]|nr:MAG: membrane protein of unknown function [Candidatus Lokiarchaeota archaeon]
MYCPNCGNELVSKDQRFCNVCGANIKLYIPDPEVIENPPKSTISPNRGISRSQYEPSYSTEQKKLVSQTGSKRFTKLCFAFGLISFIITQISGILSFTFLTGLIPNIISLLVNIVGLILAFLSRHYKKRSEAVEPVTGLRKAGSVLAIIGMVINAIGIISSIILIPLLL